MLLVIDVGNTEIVIGIYHSEELKTIWRLSSKMHRTADESWIILKMWCTTCDISLDGLKGVVISSVVPSLTAVFTEMSRKHLNLEPVIINADLDTGLTILYDMPSAVGADRICNAVAGFSNYGGPLIIVDYGTATTFDVISCKGEYLGGVIALGLLSASQELHRLAAKLPRVDSVFPPSVVGHSTESSIQSGIMWGTVSMVDGMIDKIIEEMEWSDVQIVATGGIAIKVVEKSKRIQKVFPHLTLEGMRIIFKRIQQKI